MQLLETMRRRLFGRPALVSVPAPRTPRREHHTCPECGYAHVPEPRPGERGYVELGVGRTVLYMSCPRCLTSMSVQEMASPDTEVDR